MAINWFNARDASEVGISLADQFAVPAATSASNANSLDSQESLRKLFARADREVRVLGLNFYKKAKFANSFKWRLLEKGVDKAHADEVTRQLLVYLSESSTSETEKATDNAVQLQSDLPRPNSAKSLFAHGNKCIANGDFSEAIDSYTSLLKLDPRHAAGLNNLGAALSKLGRYHESETYFHQAIKFEPNFADPYSNLGNALMVKGAYTEAESYLRRALKLNPRYLIARTNLGLTLAYVGRLREAKAQFDKVLKTETRNADALFGLAFVARTEGAFDEASELLDRALGVNPKMPQAVAQLAGMRQMTVSDKAWIDKAEALAAQGITAMDESELRFAIGKHYDDIGDFKKAFQNYKRANELLKPIAEPYDRAARKRFVDTMIDAYSRDAVARPAPGASASKKPVLIVGMPRSGTSLTEQIISSHPDARGAGEMEFWDRAASEHEAAVSSGTLSESTRSKLADAYSRALEGRAGDASRITDKLPMNANHLGMVHSVFPNARIINMKRDPIDTCLSCYFQKFIPLSFTMDLSDLADYYRQHQRLMAHWHAVLPKGAILDVPYEELVADQEGWSRKILEFLGLDWSEQVLEFHKTKRPVVTASFWQVRQKMYRNSVQRWRNYEKYIGPLLHLRQSSG